MILKALCDYYDRCRDSLPSFGLELKEIAFIIVINSSGQFVRFEDRTNVVAFLCFALHLWVYTVVTSTHPKSHM